MLLYHLWKVILASTDNLVHDSTFLEEDEGRHCFYRPFTSNVLQLDDENSVRRDERILNLNRQTTNGLQQDAFTFSSSMSTLRKITSVNLLASSTNTGAITRQGPHHEAVKSITAWDIRWIIRQSSRTQKYINLIRGKQKYTNSNKRAEISN